MNEIIILNSGGFDSVCLMHYARKLNPSTKIYSLFFDYGQKNLRQECNCAERCANSIGNCEHIVIKLPQISWSNSSVTNINNIDVESQYIEYRNLIFLSYAKSIAESKDIKDVYVAFLKQENYYTDTSPKFLEWFNEYDDIKVHAPFIDKYKEDLIPVVRSNVIIPDDFFSCNLPKSNGEPCGECSDCKCIDYIYEEVNNYLPEDMFIDNEFKFSDGFYQEYIDSGLPTNAKLYINNSCQFSCKHCLYGFKETKDPLLTMDEFKKVIDKLIDNGVTSIDFTGKEPLINKNEILGYVRYIKDKYPEVYITAITNGENIFSYTKEELGLFNSISMSVESIENEHYRTKGISVLSKIKHIVSCDVDISISIDLNKDNWKTLGFTLQDLYECGVRDFYIKPIIPMGTNGTNIIPMSPSELMGSLYIFSNFRPNDNIRKVFELKMPHINMLYKEDKIFKSFMEFYRDTRGCKFNDVIMDLELYCDLYSTYHITPDGYLLGCGFMLGSKEYDKLSPIKFLDCDNVEEAFTKAKEKQVEVMKHNILGCYFSEYATKGGCLLE